MLPFAYPAIDDAGQIWAVLIASLDLKWLSQLVPVAQLPENSSLLVIDQEGVIVSRFAVIDLQARLEESSGTVEIGDLPQVEGDPLQLRQVFQNLIGNAFKFHIPGLRPVVKVYDKISPPTDASTGKIVQIMVADNGIGFDEK